MPIQQLDINREPKKNPWADTFGAGMDAISQFAQMKNQQKQLQERSKSIQEQFGFDPTGMTDRQVEIGMQLAGQARNKQNQYQQDQDFINEYLTDNKSISESELPTKQQNIPKWKSMSDQEVAALKARDPKKGKIIEDLRSKTASNQPVDPDQLNIMRQVRLQEGFEDLNEVGQYRAYIDAGVSPINAEREATLKSAELKRHESAVDKSYSAQKDFIDKTTNQYNAFETETKPKLIAMQGLNTNEALVTPTQEWVLDTLGIPLGALEDPSSELYQKLSRDLLKGLPESYGNKILKVEVENFLQTIPTLSNSENGRRMIASSLLKLGDMKEAYYHEMRKQQKQIESSNSKYPRDFQQSVLDNVMPQLTKINQEFQQISQLTDIPPGMVPYFNPQGTISFIPDNPEDIQFANNNGGKRIW